MSETMNTICVSTYCIRVELALTQQQRRMGLMFRKTLGNQQGMLFVFPHQQPLAFWMKNTPINLWLSFINKQGVIIATTAMKPYSLHIHHLSQPVQFALEVSDTPTNRHIFKTGNKIKNFKKHLLPLVKQAH